ncbi:TPA: hypothetical protein ACGUON_000719 [Vibrio vulnificus]|uniref:hypothetical protein n=1 Tax=Vibrio vulnificus TaxID=672 RepID=UPI0028C1AEC4|nr:hypothetical protein [Vibrio vulnificus]
MKVFERVAQQEKESLSEQPLFDYVEYIEHDFDLVLYETAHFFAERLDNTKAPRFTEHLARQVYGYLTLQVGDYAVTATMLEQACLCIKQHINAKSKPKCNHTVVPEFMKSALT